MVGGRHLLYVPIQRLDVYRSRQQGLHGRHHGDGDFFGNAIGYFIAFLWSAGKFRQMRVVTPMDGIRDRFGKGNEQFFTWIWLPIGIFYAGIFVRNFYKPILRKHASEKEFLIARRIVSIFFGCLVILAALLIESFKFGLFDVMMLFSSMVAIPFIIPLIWGIIKKTPSWSGWSTVIAGFLVSLLASKFLNPEIIRKLIGLDSPFKSQEVDEYLFFSSLFLNVIVSSLWFVGSSFFAKYNTKEYARQEEEFFERMHRPVMSKPEDIRVLDKTQLKTLGRMCVPYGGFIVLLSKSKKIAL